MFVYNISVKIIREIEKEWVEWQKGEHIPAVMATGMFTSYKFYKLLEQEDEENCIYVVQYFANSRENYDRYIEEFSSTLREQASKKWGNRSIAFRTLMQVVD